MFGASVTKSEALINCLTLDVPGGTMVTSMQAIKANKSNGSSEHHPASAKEKWP